MANTLLPTKVRYDNSLETLQFRCVGNLNESFYMVIVSLYSATLLNLIPWVITV